MTNFSVAYWLDLYRTVLNIRLAVRTAYRANMVIWLVGFLIEPLVYLMVWSSVADATGGVVGGYTRSDLAAYYVAMMIVRQATAGPNPSQQVNRIREGEMNALLLRPIHPFHADFAENLSAKIFSLFALIPMIIIVGLIFSARFTSPLWSVAAFIGVLSTASLLRYLMLYAMTMLGFWTDRVDGFFLTFSVLQTFLGGMLAPLTMLPAPLQVIAAILPFRWMFAFPIDLALGQLTLNEALIGISVQVAWIIASTAIMLLLWRRGVRRYGAFGG